MRPVAARWLGASLCLGAAYDVFFGLGVLYIPGTLAGWLGIPLPEERIYLSLVGVLLLLLAGFYLASAWALRRAPELAGVAAAGRFLGFLFFLRAWSWGYPGIYLLFGILDLALAVAHGGLLLWAVRRGDVPAGPADLEP